MSGPATAMFHGTTDVDIKDSIFTNSGRDTTQIVQNNYLIGDAINHIKNSAPYFVLLTNQSTGTDNGDPLPQSGTVDNSSPSAISERDPVEISEVVPSDPTSLVRYLHNKRNLGKIDVSKPVFSIADRYTRSMLECLAGYPLYEPHPYSQFSKEYPRNGINVGDVGFVRKDGTFDFLFNICPPQNALINPFNLPDGFSLEAPELSETRRMKPLPRETCYFPRTVMKKDTGEYICKGPDGAILVLPEGAVQDEAIEMVWFEDLAKRYGVEWYKYALTRGRSISNGSLYLVTSFTKCTQWGIAVFDRPCEPGQAMTFIDNPLGWKGLGALTTKIADPNEENVPNQCVFLQGIKIMIREDIFNSLPKRAPASRIRGGGGTDFFSKILTGLRPARTTIPTVKKSDEVVLQPNFNSPPVHPSDFINSALLSQYPDAKIALTHDRVWCDILQGNFPEFDCMKFRDIAQSYIRTIDEYGCVSLKKTPDSSNVVDDSSCPVQRNEILTPQVPVQGSGDEDNFSISTPEQAPTTLRPQSIDDPLGPEGNTDISVEPSQAPPTTDHLPRIGKTQTPNVANIGTSEAHVHRPSVMSVSRQEGPEPVDTNTEARGFPTHARDVSYMNQFPSETKTGNVTKVYGATHEKSVLSDAQFDSPAQDSQCRCHPGTRENVLKTLRDWADNPNAKERISWLYGPAGAGKSAIAQTIAHSYGRPKVAASFFFRSDINRNDGSLLVTTLAYQLTISIPAIRDRIARSLHEHPDLLMADIETQFKQLLVRPLETLSKDTTRQLASSIIIIDGLDECADKILPRQFLEVLDDAVVYHRFPLRFLIVSRSEQHIEYSICHLHSPIRCIDLAGFHEANRDVEKYLVDEFHRIASKRGLESTWPGKNIIDDIVYKSSGNFLLASVIIRLVGDPDNPHNAPFDVLNMKRSTATVLPFAVLDQFLSTILRRVQDQDFLKRYLALLTARIAVSSDCGELYKDDAVLMHVSEKELHAKLRRMRSLLKFGDRIDVYNRSFLDFLHDLSRSGQYHIQKENGTGRYLKLFVDSLIRYVLNMIKRPDHRNALHFTPRFRVVIKDFPPNIELPVNEWQEVTRPLLDLFDKLLQLPNSASICNLLRCDECTVFHLLRELVHLGLHIPIFKGHDSDASIRSVVNVRKRRGIVSLTGSKRENEKYEDLDDLLLSLFARLPKSMKHWSPNEEIIKFTDKILAFDATEIAGRIRFISDAQTLVDYLVYLIDEKSTLCTINPDATRKTTLLALDVFARVPIFPLPAFSNRMNKVHRNPWINNAIPIQILSQTIFAARLLDHRYIVPVLAVEKGKDGVLLVSDDGDGNNLTIEKWRRTLIASPATATQVATQVILGIAKAIQYCHSMGVLLYREFGLRNVILDSDFRPKIRCVYSTSRSLLDNQCKAWFLLEDNIFCFGCLFYEIFYGVDTKPSLPTKERRRLIGNHKPIINPPSHTWQLIQKCCAQDARSRPTMDKIVEDMESWNMK